jgi:phospholipase D1/2
MGSARARLLKLVRDADRDGRFRIYTPVTKGGEPIYVHAKVLVMDDRLLRIGSSNLNNRSLGYDTECDLAVEALPGPGEAELRRRIGALRDDLLAEHLGCEPKSFSEAVEGAAGSIIGAIESLCGEGRTLKPFEPPHFGVGDALAENDLLDPERAAPAFPRLRRWTGRLRHPLAGSPRRTA